MFLQFLGIVLAGCLTTQSAAVPQGRVVYGNIAANYQFPWHVSLTSTTNSGKVYCGGSLIGSRYVLTAASCIVNATTIKADFGSINFSTPKETQTTSGYMIHPLFNARNNMNNIAIIRLNDEVWYTNDKRPILLVGEKMGSLSLVNTTSFISGFGVSQNGANVLSENLRYAFATVVLNELCQQFFPSSYVRSENMCTMGYINSQQSACYGDQGGALVTNVDGSWQQIGVISTIHASGCTGMYPNLHTRVQPYLQWIHQMTGMAINP